MLIYGSTVLPIVLAGLLLDRLLGEPEVVWSRVPHPVALLGRLVAWTDRHLNRPESSDGANRLRGAAALAFVTFTVLIAGFVLALLARSGTAAILIEGLVVAVLLAQKSLVEHVRSVAEALEADLERARREVGRIVGRDTAGLDRSGVARAAIESCAENFSDGVVAPALAYALFGLPGLLLYKAVNTADSMIGHRDARYRTFGWAAARTDDLLNLAPSRLAALLYALTGLRRAAEIWRRTRTDAPRHRSPNAGWPEAALAARLGLALGGPRRYGDVRVDGVWLNPAGRREADARDVRKAIAATDRAWLLMTLGVLLLAVATG